MISVRKFKITNASFCIMVIIFSNFNLCCNATIITSSIGSNQIDLYRTPKFFQENCTCSTQWQCKCCAKVDNNLLNVHQTLCADWMIFSNSWNIQANLRLNENILYTNIFSAWNIPPFCIPIWPAIALTGCIQIHSITQHENNMVHGCANVTINFITFNLVNFQLGCMDVGTGGVHFVEPNHQVVGTNSTEKPPEIELETTDFIKLNTHTMKNVEVNADLIIEKSTIRQDTFNKYF